MQSLPADIGTRYDEWMDGGAYSDDQAAAASGLGVRALRELHQIGALTPLSSRPGRGNKRLWDRSAIIRAALTASVMMGSYSLPVAARIAIAWTNSYFIKDAFSYAPDWAAIKNLQSTQWAPEREEGDKIHLSWMSDDFAAGQVDPHHDAYLEIIDGEHLIARTINYERPLIQGFVDPANGDRAIVRLGRIANGGSAIVAADYIDATRPLTPAQVALFDQVVDGESVRDILKRFDVEHLGFLKGGGRLVDPEFLGLSIEDRLGPKLPDETPQERRHRIDQAKADEERRTLQILATAKTVLSINMTLTQRLVMRRILGLPNDETRATELEGSSQ